MNHNALIAEIYEALGIDRNLVCHNTSCNGRPYGWHYKQTWEKEDQYTDQYHGRKGCYVYCEFHWEKLRKRVVGIPHAEWGLLE